MGRRTAKDGEGGERVQRHTLSVRDVDRLLLKLINSPKSSPELAGSVVRPSLPCCSGEGLFLPTDLKVI